VREPTVDRVPRLERIALVVDDDTFVLSALAELLSEDGYDVHTASNGFSAVRMAVECRPLLVLLDLALPERSGTEVLAELRGHTATRDVAIVVVTGNPRQLTEAQLADIDGLLSKPFDVPELMATVQRAVRQALIRHAEVAPVAPMSHTAPAVRPRRARGVRHSRGRR
jgi:CheY-like chemotaxis protein